ncbi:MAG: hypothetical protein AAGL89_01455 [Pseudomonadota bacterium]
MINAILSPFAYSAQAQLGIGPMDICLHLGAHRTATTSFQSALRSNTAHLARCGLTCWTPAKTRDGLMRGLIRHPEDATLQDDEQGLRSVGRLKITLHKLEADGHRALLISEPNMLGTGQTNLRTHLLYPQLDERLRRFVPAFGDRPLTVGLSIRSYEDYWTSLLCSQFRVRMAGAGAERLDRLTTQPRRWRRLIRDIARVLPQAHIVVWAFEQMGARSNDQLNALWPQGQAVLSGGDPWLARSPDLFTLQQMGYTAPKGQGDGKGVRWMPFDEDQRSVLRAEYRQDLAWLRAGAEGLATFIDGRQTPAVQPDRGDAMMGPVHAGTEDRGHGHGIKERLG